MSSADVVALGLGTLFGKSAISNAMRDGIARSLSHAPRAHQHQPASRAERKTYLSTSPFFLTNRFVAPPAAATFAPTFFARATGDAYGAGFSPRAASQSNGTLAEMLGVNVGDCAKEKRGFWRGVVGSRRGASPFICAPALARTGEGAGDADAGELKRFVPRAALVGVSVATEAWLVWANRRRDMSATDGEGTRRTSTGRSINHVLFGMFYTLLAA